MPMEYPVPDPLDVEQLYNTSYFNVPAEKIVNSEGNLFEKNEIQKAVDDIKGGFGFLILPQMHVKTGTIDLREKGVAFFGRGPRQTEIELANGANENLIECTPTSDTFWTGFYNLGLLGNRANNTSGDVIHFSNVDGGRVRDNTLINCRVMQAPDRNIYLDPAENFKITQSWVEFTDGSNLVWNGGTVTAVGGVFGGDVAGKNVVCNGGRFLASLCWMNNGTIAFHHDGGLRSRLECCSFKNADNQGILIDGGASEVQIIGGQVENNSQSGVGNYPGVSLGTNTSECELFGVYMDGRNQESYNVEDNGTDNRINARIMKNAVTGSVNRAGTRLVVNGLGLNSGDPRTTGDWNGEGYPGVTVRDITNAITYRYMNGAWRSI